MLSFKTMKTCFFTILSFLMMSCASGTEKPLRPGETIIVLGFPATEDGQPTPLMKYRLDKALRLINHRNIGTIIVSGGAVQNRFPEASVMKKYLMENGVPEDKIIVEDRATSTFGNAYESRKILKKYHLENPIIVTSEEHQPRAKATFSMYISEFRMAD